MKLDFHKLGNVIECKDNLNNRQSRTKSKFWKKYGVIESIPSGPIVVLGSSAPKLLKTSLKKISIKFKSITFDGISFKEILIGLFLHLNIDLKYEPNKLAINTPSFTE